jgi:hypothetical protein
VASDPSRSDIDHHDPAVVAKVELRLLAESLARGQPCRGKIALTAMSDRIREMI